MQIEKQQSEKKKHLYSCNLFVLNLPQMQKEYLKPSKRPQNITFSKLFNILFSFHQYVFLFKAFQYKNILENYYFLFGYTTVINVAINKRKNFEFQGVFNLKMTTFHFFSRKVCFENVNTNL